MAINKYDRIYAIILNHHGNESFLLTRKNILSFFTLSNNSLALAFVFDFIDLSFDPFTIGDLTLSKDVKSLQDVFVKLDIIMKISE